jgi:hypothetical protein
MFPFLTLNTRTQDFAELDRGGFVYQTNSRSTTLAPLPSFALSGSRWWCCFPSTSLHDI